MVTLTIKAMILLSRITVTVMKERMPAFCNPLIFGLVRMLRPSLAVELIRSEAGLSASHAGWDNPLADPRTCDRTPHTAQSFR